MRLTSLLVVTSLLVLAAPLRARADPTETAKIHYQAGEQHYLRGRYDEAIREFLEAYRLTSAPALLYNVSQAYERKGDLVQARAYLARYLETNDPEPTERPALEDKLRTLDDRIAAARRPVPTTPPPPLRRPFRIAKWVVGGTGVALLVASLIFAIDSARMDGKVEDAANGTRPFDSDIEDLYDRGERDEVLAWSLGIAGAAMAATGAVLFWLDHRALQTAETRRAARVAPLLGPGVAGATVLWRF